jgi:hypothetical protein
MQKRSTTFRVLTGLVLVLAVYVLSAGPAMWLVARTGYGKSACAIVYAPLRPLAGGSFGNYLATWAYYGAPDREEPSEPRDTGGKKPSSKPVGNK